MGSSPIRVIRSPERASMFPRRQIHLLVALAFSSVAACNDADSPAAPRRVLTTVVVSVGSPAIEVGELTGATISALDQDGAPIETGAVAWTSDKPEVAAVNPTTGLIFAIAPGTTN